MKEFISNNAVVFCHPYTGELFIFDNEKERYGYCDAKENLKWTEFNGLEKRKALKIAGCDGVALVQLYDQRDNSYKLMLITGKGECAKIYATYAQEYLEPFVGDDGYLSFVLQNQNNMQSVVGYIKKEVDGDDKQYDLNKDAFWGPWVSVGLSHTEISDEMEYDFHIIPIEGKKLSSGFNFTAVCQDETADVFVVDNFSENGRNALGLENDTVQNWIEVCNSEIIEGQLDEYDDEYEMKKGIICRRVLGSMLEDSIAMIGAKWNMMGNGNPKEYYDNLLFHHPESYLEYMLMIDRGDKNNSKADLITVARDCRMFITKIWKDSDGKPKYEVYRRYTFDDCISCLAYDKQQDVVYFAGEKGLVGFLDADYNCYSGSYSSSRIRILKTNSITHMLATHNTDNELMIMDVSTPKSRSIKRQIPLFNSEIVDNIALHKDFVYVQYRNGELERHSI